MKTYITIIMEMLKSYKILAALLAFFLLIGIGCGAAVALEKSGHPDGSDTIDVQFEEGLKGGDQVASIQVAPSPREGYTFTGWYTSADYIYRLDSANGDLLS